MNRKIIRLVLAALGALLVFFILPGFQCYTSDVFLNPSGGGGNGGKTLWTFSANTSPQPGELKTMYSSPAIGSDGTIYVGSYDNYIYAIDINGNRVWATRTGGDINTSPAVGPDGTIYIGSTDGVLYALEPAGGSQKWSIPTGAEEVSSVSVASDGTVYFSTDGGYTTDSYFYSVTPQGDTNWRVQTWDGITNPPVIASNGTVYFYSNDIYAVDPADGTTLWEYDVETAVSGAIAIGSDGTIYYSDGVHSRLCSVNPSTHTENWNYPFAGYSPGGPAIGSDGTVYVTCSDGSLYAFTPYGDLKWEYHACSPADGISSRITPAVGSDGVIYFGTSSSEFFAVNSDGTLAWSVELDGGVSNSANIASGGTVVVGIYGSIVYGLNCSSDGLASSPWPSYNHDQQNTGRQGG